MVIFFSWALRYSAIAIEPADNMAADRNIVSKACIDGNDSMLLPTLIVDWYICMNTPATAGPTELPRILNSVFMPSDMPVCWMGVASKVTFSAPTLVSDRPVESTARSSDTETQLP